MNDKSALYTVSELAVVLGVTPRTIRHYEEKSLLSPRRVGANRIFDYRDKARLTLILRLKNLGFSLDQIKEYMDLYDVDETRVTQLKVGFNAICDRISNLDTQINQMQGTLSELRALKEEAVIRLRERGVDPDRDL